MISVALNPDVEQRLAQLARRRALSEGDFARELIEACVEDLDDIQMATGPFGKPSTGADCRTGPESPWAGGLI